jgi:LysM repeat protein
MVFFLLFLALVVPVAGAVALRLLNNRLSETQITGSAAVFFALAIVSVLVLSRLPVSSLTIGKFTLLLPLSGPVVSNSGSEDVPLAPPEPMLSNGDNVMGMPTVPISPTSSITLTTTPALTPTVPISPTATPTLTPTVPISPTATPTLTPTVPISPTATPTLTPMPTDPPVDEGPQTYTVQEGDLLRDIAETYDVTVSEIMEANDLTPEEADALRPGQELIIP